MSPSKIARTSSLRIAAVGLAALVAAGTTSFAGLSPVEASAVTPPSKRLYGAAQQVTKVAKASDAPVVSKPAVKKVARRKAVKRRRTYQTGWMSARTSWYGPGFYGRTMAGGGQLTRKSMVVAHRTMKFGTKIEIKYRGRTVVAEVRDRGPYVSGRQFDLGPGTARALRFGGVGTIRYRIIKRG